MSAVLQRYGVDPRELSQEQLYKLALILQLVQTQDKTGTVTCVLLRLLKQNEIPLLVQAFLRYKGEDLSWMPCFLFKIKSVIMKLQYEASTSALYLYIWRIRD